MHDIALIPGAAHNAASMLPLQARDDTTIIPVDYPRGGPYRPTTREPHMLQTYARRIWSTLRALDRPIDLFAWSMGAPVSLGVTRLADKESPGLIRNIVMITPGVFHGSPYRNFHRTPAYTYKLMFPPIRKTLRRSAAIREIQQEIPDFDPEVDEDSQAMLESGDGVMRIPRGFDRKRISFYYAPEDDVIPEDISRHVAKRARIPAHAISGYGHELPLLDTDGSALTFIRGRHQ